MRFFVLDGSAVRGPLTVDFMRSWPGLSPETPVCPEDRDHKNSGNWKAAASYPQLFDQPGAAIPERDGGAARFWSSAVAKARAAQALAAAQAPRPGQGGGWVWLSAAILSLLAIGLLDLGRPDPGPARDRTSARPTLIEQAAPLFLPARLPRDEAQRLRGLAGVRVVGGQAQIVLPADGRNLKAEALFTYDPQRRELRPINDAARGLLDIRRGYPKL